MFRPFYLAIFRPPWITNTLTFNWLTQRKMVYANVKIVFPGFRRETLLLEGRRVIQSRLLYATAVLTWQLTTTVFDSHNMAADLEVPLLYSQDPLAVASEISIRIARLLLRCVLQSLALTVTRIHSIPFQVEMLRQIPNHCSQLTGLHLNKRNLITAYFTLSIKHRSSLCYFALNLRSC
jgi:hypothetical protein